MPDARLRGLDLLNQLLPRRRCRQKPPVCDLVPAGRPFKVLRHPGNRAGRPHGRGPRNQKPAQRRPLHLVPCADRDGRGEPGHAAGEGQRGSVVRKLPRATRRLAAQPHPARLLARRPGRRGDARSPQPGLPCRRLCGLPPEHRASLGRCGQTSSSHIRTRRPDLGPTEALAGTRRPQRRAGMVRWPGGRLAGDKLGPAAWQSRREARSSPLARTAVAAALRGS